MRRLIILGLTALVVAAPLAACGSSQPSKPAGPTPAQVAAQKKAKQAALDRKLAAASRKAKAAEHRVQVDLAKISLEQMISKDAKEKVADGLFDGPIKHVTCDPASTADSTGTEDTFNCLAVDKTNGDGTESGYGYIGTANYATGTISAHLGNS
jgi:hypothetical protein